MVGSSSTPRRLGYAVFFLTGRPRTRRPAQSAPRHDREPRRPSATTSPTRTSYLKDANATTQPWLSSCAPTCTTTQYKSLTRQHIESLGYDIVANFGDQFSDLNGGFADQTFKVPNPMYFLP